MSIAGEDQSPSVLEDSKETLLAGSTRFGETKFLSIIAPSIALQNYDIGAEDVGFQVQGKMTSNSSMKVRSLRRSQTREQYESVQASSRKRPPRSQKEEAVVPSLP